MDLSACACAPGYQRGRHDVSKKKFQIHSCRPSDHNFGSYHHGGGSDTLSMVTRGGTLDDHTGRRLHPFCGTAHIWPGKYQKADLSKPELGALAAVLLSILIPFLLRNFSLQGINWPLLMYTVIFGSGWLIMGILLIKEQ